MWARDCSCGVLTTNMAAFCPCPKSLSKAKVRRVLDKFHWQRISKQPSSDSVVWLLVFTLTKIYNEMIKLRKRENIQIGENRRIRTWKGLNSVFKKINRLRNGVKGVVTSGQDPTQLSSQLVKGN